ncbi:hypothetical protein [Hyphococcus sp.]|uniref:hypothetical protein n=1 Tax=Hyphococcus sp. TaxID=2038636 RepID=UPI0020801B0B|nr:MAG: hypothetical protein DHS20C04_27830 [Marinicaulis sp.]
MQLARITSIAFAMTAGFSMGPAQASASPAAFEEPIIMLASADAEARKSVSFDFKGVLHSFISVEEQGRTTKVATAGHDAKECQVEKEKSEAKDTKDAKKSAKKGPQGPEPIYFAF